MASATRFGLSAPTVQEQVHFMSGKYTQLVLAIPWRSLATDHGTTLSGRRQV